MQFEYIAGADGQLTRVLFRRNLPQSYLIKDAFTHTNRPFELLVMEEIKVDVINFIEMMFTYKDVMAFKSNVEKGMFRINQAFNMQEVKQIENFINTLKG